MDYSLYKYFRAVMVNEPEHDYSAKAKIVGQVSWYIESIVHLMIKAWFFLYYI